MARFRFKMESLLRLNENIEEQKKNEFGKAAAELALQRQKLQHLVDTKKDSLLEFQDNVKNHIDPEKNDMFNKYLVFLNDCIKAQEKQVKMAEDFLEVKRLQLIEATKEKKKMEKLKEKKYEEYITEEKREEQKITDQVVSYQSYTKGRIRQA